MATHDQPIDLPLASVVVSVLALDLVGSPEIAKMLDLTQQRVNEPATQDPTFLDPATALSAGRIWKLADLEKWPRKARRLAP